MMTAADEAFAKAERLIAEAKRTGATNLSFDTETTHALTRLPDSIAGLTKLTSLYLVNTPVSDLTPLAGVVGMTTLFLGNTKVRDLTKLAGMVAMTTLYLSNTPVSDLTPLAGMVGMKTLYLTNTPVSDLKPLAGMVAMTMLDLRNTPVSDLTPLAGMVAMTRLDLRNTQVSDLTPLAGMVGMKTLYLTNTPVSDLRVVRQFPKLATEPSLHGLTFGRTLFVQTDARAKKIAAIKAPKARAAALFEYLKDWVPPGERDEPSQNAAPLLPAARPAPIQTEVVGDRLVLSHGTGLAVTDANTRAAFGWEAIKEFRDSFGKSFNVSNYAPLPSILRSFDRAMGDGYDDKRQIAMGLHGQRIIDLASDRAFLDTLPIGAETEMKGLAAAIEVFVNRFPDWLAYKQEADTSPPVAVAVRAARKEFNDIGNVLAESANVEEALKTEFLDEIKAGTDAKASETEAKGLLASATETIRTLAEASLNDVKAGRSAKVFAAQMRKTGESELPKLWYWTGGFAVDLLVRSGPALRRLAKRFPGRMGYLERFLDYFGICVEDPDGQSGSRH